MIRRTSNAHICSSRVCGRSSFVAATVAEIDKYSAELACTRQALSKNRTHNTALIANFAKLLEVPETESQPVA